MNGWRELIKRIRQNEVNAMIIQITFEENCFKLITDCAGTLDPKKKKQDLKKVTVPTLFPR